MLELCYTLELLGGSTMSGVAGSLRQARASFTEPWLALVLATAAVLALYNGLIRRRVAETLGQALTTITMMAVGLWVIADPLGTVGAVGQWANQASLGTLGAIAQGTPANAPRTLGDSMRVVFAGAIEMPWCYLEFGNVRWCSDPAQLDPRLRKAGLLIEASQKAMIGCKPSTVAQLCAAAGSPAALIVEHSNRLMRQATTNGALFLAFPANGPERNSVTDRGSLLHVLCQTENDKKCTGPTAAQAEFRSDSGTSPRMIGVVLIAAGVLGMVMLFGLIALHLLAAAVVSLFMLLLAPFAVLAPAFGDGGRAVFGGWLTRLLGAVTSKLLFSFLLGALLTMQRILTSLQSFGWWTEWLLISAFWWVVFLKRHQAQTFLRSRGREPIMRNRRPIGQRFDKALQGRAEAVRHPLRWARGKVLSPVPATEQLQKRGYRQQQGNGKRAAEQQARTQEHPILPRTRETPRPSMRPLFKREQLERVRAAREAALADGDRRRAAKLAIHALRIEAQTSQEHERFDGAPPIHARSDEAEVSNAREPTGLPGVRESGESQLVRTTPPMSSDHQWDKRSGEQAGSASRTGDGRGRAESPPGSASDTKPRDSAPRGSAGDGESNTFDTGGPRPSGAGSARTGRERKSPIMDDARAVAEQRKRQLGFGPPSEY